MGTLLQKGINGEEKALWDVRKVLQFSREKWQMPLSPAMYILAIEGMLHISIEEALIIWDDAVNMGISQKIPLPSIIAILEKMMETTAEKTKEEKMEEFKYYVGVLYSFNPGDMIQLHGYERAYWLNGMVCTVRAIRPPDKKKHKVSQLRIEIDYLSQKTDSEQWYPQSVSIQNVNKISTQQGGTVELLSEYHLFLRHPRLSEFLELLEKRRPWPTQGLRCSILVSWANIDQPNWEKPLLNALNNVTLRCYALNGKKIPPKFLEKLESDEKYADILKIMHQKLGRFLKKKE